MSSLPKRIFISHSSADKGMARTLASELRTHGFDAWLDEHEIQPGQFWAEAIRTKLDNSDAFVLLISEDSQHSPWARLESSEILKRTWADQSKVVLPVIIGSAEPPGYLRDHVAVRVEPDHSSSAVQALLHSLTAPAVPRGVNRSAAGDTRLERRLAELQHTAAKLAADDEDE